MVDDTRLELAGAGRFASGVRGGSARRRAQTEVTSSRLTFHIKKKTATLSGDCSFLVDDTRLEFQIQLVISC